MKTIFVRFLFVLVCAILLFSVGAYSQTPKQNPTQNQTVPAPVTVPNDKEVVDAYHYLLGRMLVLRQEILDFKGDFKWNQLIPRKGGQVTWANPNLDVAYSEAWLAIDSKSCAQVTMPQIKNRYYTFQLLNSWGETVSNLNDRTYPKKSFGKFVYCTKDSTVKTSPDIERINLDGHKFRALARIELGNSPKEALYLQKQMKISMIGTVSQIAKPVDIPMFTNKELPGVEIFDKAEEVMLSEPDINPGMESLQQIVMKVTQALRNKDFKAKAETLIRDEAIPELSKALQRNGTVKNGWLRPSTIGNYGSDFLTRTMVNYGGIWANSNSEVIYFRTNMDGEEKPLNGSNTYTMHFAKEDDPKQHAKYFWSIVAVDAEKFQVIQNSKKKYSISNHTKMVRNKDGSFTLVFANKLPRGVNVGNWMPTPEGKNYHLTFRLYGPDDAVRTGDAFPPPLVLKDPSEKLSFFEDEYDDSAVLR